MNLPKKWNKKENRKVTKLQIKISLKLLFFKIVIKNEKINN